MRPAWHAWQPIQFRSLRHSAMSRTALPRPISFRPVEAMRGRAHQRFRGLAAARQSPMTLAELRPLSAMGRNGDARIWQDDREASGGCSLLASAVPLARPVPCPTASTLPPNCIASTRERRGNRCRCRRPPSALSCPPGARSPSRMQHEPGSGQAGSTHGLSIAAAADEGTTCRDPKFLWEIFPLIASMLIQGLPSRPWDCIPRRGH